MDYLTKKQKSFLIHSYIEWAQKIAEEWKSTSNEPIQLNSKLVCELCGNPNCKCLFEIINTITKVRLNVGSSCINKFKSISKTFKGYKDINQLMRKRKAEFNKLNRESILKEVVGDKSDNYQKWQRATFDYVLPYEKEDNRNKLISNFISLYNNFINNKFTGSDTDLFKTMNRLKVQIEDIDLSINNKQKKYSIYKFYCPYYIEKWIEKTYEDNTAIILKIKNNNGILDKDTIKYIYNETYLNNFTETINELLINTPLKISNIVNNEVHFKIKGYSSDVYILSRIFMEMFGERIIKKAPTISYKEILSVLKANANSESTLSEIIEMFNDAMIKLNYKIITKEIKYSDDIIQDKNFLICTNRKEYASKLNNFENTFLQTCIKYLFDPSIKKPSEKIYDIIKRISSWSSIDEINEYKEINRY